MRPMLDPGSSAGDVVRLGRSALQVICEATGARALTVSTIAVDQVI